MHAAVRLDHNLVAVDGEHTLTIPALANLVSAGEAKTAEVDTEVREEVLVLKAARARHDTVAYADEGEFDIAFAWAISRTAAASRSIDRIGEANRATASSTSTIRMTTRSRSSRSSASVCASS